MLPTIQGNIFRNRIQAPKVVGTFDVGNFSKFIDKLGRCFSLSKEMLRETVFAGLCVFGEMSGGKADLID